MIATLSAAFHAVAAAVQAVTGFLWSGGWWDGAKRSPCHPKRLGGKIKPWCVVVHTTDMTHETFRGLVRNWTTEPGHGNAAHFLIGRDEHQGVLQFAPIDRNANHAGGPMVDGRPAHGWLDVYDSRKGIARLHPNAVTVGIEVHNAGHLRRPPMGSKLMAGWYYVSDGRWQRIPDAEVHVDAAGRGWHRITPWQFDVLGRLLRDLEGQLARRPSPVKVVPNGEPQSWAGPPTVSLVGHVTLDPNRKTDPGPQMMTWLRETFPEYGAPRA